LTWYNEHHPSIGLTVSRKTFKLTVNPQKRSFFSRHPSKMQIDLAVKKFQGTERFHMTTRGHIGAQKNETAAMLVFQNQSRSR